MSSEICKALFEVLCIIGCEKYGNSLFYSRALAANILWKYRVNGVYNPN
jgi:hypothetical protein